MLFHYVKNPRALYIPLSIMHGQIIRYLHIGDPQDSWGTFILPLSSSRSVTHCQLPIYSFAMAGGSSPSLPSSHNGRSKSCVGEGTTKRGGELAVDA